MSESYETSGTSSSGISYETNSDNSIDKQKTIRICGKKTNMKKKELIAISLLSIAFFLNYCYFSLFVPFFPGEATRKGMNQTKVGAIFSIFQLVQLIASPIFGKYMDAIGLRFLFVAGLFLSSTSEIIFGFVNRSPSGYMYLITCLLCRGVTAVGSSMGLSYAVVGYFFPDNIATVVAILEMFSGFGLMVGPVLGGFLYQLGGFQMPFFVMGGIQFLLFILSWFIFPGCESQTPRSNKSEEKAMPIIPLIKIPKFSLTLLVLFTGGVSINILEPSIQLHLIPLNLTPVQLGLVFFIPALLYVLVTPLVGYLCDKFPKTMPLIMMSNLLCSIIAYSLFGPLPLLHLPLSLSTFLIGYLIFGISFSGLIVPVYSELTRIATSNGYPKDLRTHGLISGLFNAVYSSGALIGPIIGGIVIDHIGFADTTYIVVLLFLVTGVLYIFFYLLQFNKQTKINNEIDEKITENSALIA